MATEGEIRATSDLMLSMLDRLRAAEEAKREQVPGSGEFAQLAFDVMELSRTVARWSELQLRQANEAMSRASRTTETLNEVRPRRLDEVLAEWRKAEIRFSQARPDDPEAQQLADEVEHLRMEYRELQARKLADHAAGG